MSQYLNVAGKFTGKAVKDASNGLFETPSGTPGIRLVLEVTETGEYEGQLVTWTGWLSDKAFDFTVKALNEAFSFSGNFAEIAEMPDLFAEQPCSFETEMEPSENDASKVYCKVKWLNPVGGRGGNAPVLEKHAAVDLAKRMSGRAQALLKSATTGGSAPPRQPSMANADTPY